MKNVVSAKARVTLYCFLVFGLALMSCRPGAGSGSFNTASSEGVGDVANAELCKKYEACGCQQFEQCMRDAANTPELQKPEVRECLMKSSCPSLCAGHPDACFANSGPQDAGTSGPGQVPQKPGCAQIHCTSKSDCPTECYGGCGMGVCLSF